jgi:hypothetical protein
VKDTVENIDERCCRGTRTAPPSADIPVVFLGVLGELRREPEARAYERCAGDDGDGDGKGDVTESQDRSVRVWVTALLAPESGVRYWCEEGIVGGAGWEWAGGQYSGRRPTSAYEAAGAGAISACRVKPAPTFASKEGAQFWAEGMGVGTRECRHLGR